MTDIFNSYIITLQEDILNLPIIILVLLSVAGISFIIQMIYYLGFFTAIFRHKRQIKKGKITHIEPKVPVSVIICAKNEDDNLLNFLPEVLKQDYPDYEVIVVNDGSTDDTEDYLKNLSSEYHNLRTTFVPLDAKFIDSKKFAMTLGIKAARNNVLVFTDADCYPKTDQWLKSIVRNFDKNTDIVLGYGAYSTRKDLLSYIISYDTLFIAIQYLNYAKIGVPYMGVGRNMAYRKNLFTNSKGFTNHLNIQSGDDDLFVNDVATKQNTRIEIAAESKTISIPKETFKDWFMQKARHMSTSSYYKLSSKLMLGFEMLSRVLFYTCIIALCVSGNIFAVTCAVAGLLIRYISQYTIINITAKQFDERRFWFGVMFLDIIIPLLHLAAKVKDMLRGKQQYKWK